MNDHLCARKRRTDVAFNLVADLMGAHQAHRGIEFDVNLDKGVDTGGSGQVLRQKRLRAARMCR